MNERMLGSLDVLERMTHSIENSITVVRDQSCGKIAPKSEECLRQAIVKSIELARLISDARGWEITAQSKIYKES